MAKQLEKFGAGNFGSWIYDAYGMPCYRYECNQYKLEEKMPLVNKDNVWGDYRSHYSQFGNYRIIAIPHNFGYVRIRQDEGTCKFINEYYPQDKQYAGGFGYFKYDDEIVSTYYKEQPDFERYFGAGYFKKISKDKKVTIEQNIITPFGDDPVIIDEIKITNNSDKEIRGSWTEYWGTFTYQISMRPWMFIAAKHLPQGILYELRRQFARNFKKSFTKVNNGARLHQDFIGYKYPEKNGVIPSIQEINELCSPEVGKGNYEDLHIADFYVTCLNDDVKTSVRFDGQAFFENEDLLKPTGLISDKTGSLDDSFFLNSEITIKPGESKRLVYLVCYVPDHFTYEELLAKYSKHNDVLKETVEAWKENQIAIDIKDDPDSEWIKREMMWHNFYLGEAISFDRGMDAHVISQGGYYQYIMGVNGGIRDSVQHMMPYIYTNPSLAKELMDWQLRLIAGEGTAYGGGIVGDGVCASEDPRNNFVENKDVAGFKNTPASRELTKEQRIERRFSDQEFWLMWCVCEYIRVQKDYDYLYEEKADLYYGEKRKVIDLLISTFDYFKNDVGLGKHGLNRLLVCDWCRVLFHPFYRQLSDEDRSNGPKIAESLFNSALAVYTCDLFSDVLKEVGHPRAQEIKDYANGIREAVKKTWNGKWIPRAWISDSYGYVGDENELLLEPQPFVLLANILDSDKNNTLIANIKKYAMDPSPIGALKQNRVEGVDAVKNDGWVWWSINGLLIWSLIEKDNKLAWNEFIKNSLARHAEEYPDVWFGIWSNSDNYCGINSKYPGYTRWECGGYDIMGEKERSLHEKIEYTTPNALDFPVSIMHPHAWPLYDVIQFLRPEGRKDLFKITPSLPKEEYSITSPLIGYNQEKHHISGWYNPLGKGTYNYEFVLNKKPTTFKVNGQSVPYQYEDGTIKFTYDTKDKLEWEMTY